MAEPSKPSNLSTQTHYIFHASFVIVLMTIVGVIFMLTLRSNKNISELENRRLASWPVFSIESLLDGQYTRSIETYLADHFPARHYFNEAAFAIRAHRGLHFGDRVIQVKGAETGFEDVTQWASAPEIDPTPNLELDTETEAAAKAEVNTEPEKTIENEVKDENKLTHIQESSPDIVSNNTNENNDINSDQALNTAKLDDTQPLEKSVSETSVAHQNVTTNVEKIETIQSANIVTTNDPVKPVAEIQARSEPAPATALSIPAPALPPTPAPSAPPVPPAKAAAPLPSASSASSAASAANQTQHNKPLNVVGGVLLHDGQALFMFQGTDRGAQGYANAVNTWVELIANKRPGMTATVVVTPTSSHFYLPPAARARTTSESKNLAAMKAALLPEVRFADVISEMEGHQDEGLFYKSDHHWTGLGAYYAYRAWAKAVGVTPLDLSAFDKRSVPGVAGSFWSLTQAPELRNADKESYYYVPTTVTFDGTQYTGPQQKTPVPQPFFAEKSRGYIVFLGGDIPLLVSNTNAGTGRTALVIKNSYGNAFAPYLLPHFDRVVVLDYRYVSRNIQDIVDTFGVTDLVFVNATITANSGAHQERMRQVARGSSTAWLTEAEKRRIKQQEDAANKVQASTSASGAAQ